jgi:hypothetical protein
VDDEANVVKLALIAYHLSFQAWARYIVDHTDSDDSKRNDAKGGMDSVRFLAFRGRSILQISPSPPKRI